MVIETSDNLLKALHESRLFDADEFHTFASDLEPFGTDLPGIIQYILKNERLTIYQLRKILQGKGSELVIGSYKILDRLGEGGMGRVFRARQVRVGREVALKVIRPSLLANPIVRGRYEREVEAASSLRHPNIVAVEDAGSVDGKYYLAMEFVDGIDLAILTRDHRPLEIPEACEYARQTAMGLLHAHEAGFVHRDIKPSNIVVAGERHVPQATEPAVVKILDMGLIRAIGLEEIAVSQKDSIRARNDSSALTRDGAVVGTPDYMAPEQAKDSRAVDHRADLYSLGCTLYFLLTGQPPFPEGTSGEKVLRHQFDHPAPLQALRPDVPTSVAAIVARLMAKNPADRFPDAAIVAENLAPLSIYPSGSQPVPLMQRRGRRVAGAETPVASDRSTFPSARTPYSDGVSGT
ncbi:MAG TPA: serine/threonine-protein kinase [Gemmata sp.]|nr:serine/threonine-protein kinase [Gemmata sp.]